MTTESNVRSDPRGTPPRSGLDAFFHISHPIYEKYFPTQKERRLKLPRIADIQPAELDPRLFELVHFECFPLIMHYTTKQFIELIGTYSPTLSLPEDKRQAFLHDIQKCVEQDFDGSILRHFAMSLTVAKKLH